MTCAGCRPGLEDAPDDIDDPIRHFFVHAEDDDPAALTSALDLFTAFLLECEDTAADDGNERPECDLEQGLSTSMIDDGDVDELIALGKHGDHPTDEQWEQAVSIVVARKMPMTVEQVEGVLMLPDQQDVFPQFDSYERTYLTDQEDYLAATEPFLRTENDVVSNYVLDVTATYKLWLDFRQLDWTHDGQTYRVVLVRSWFDDDAVLSLDGASVGFTYSIEILIPYPTDPTQLWRTQGLWSHADLPLDGDDHDFWENQLRDGTIDGFDQLQTWVDEH
jgi:hypothetical protein